MPISYTPSHVQQIRAALVRYHAEQLSIKPFSMSNYDIEIMSRLDIKSERAEVKPHDITNFIRKNHVPDDDKLKLYERFVKSVYPGFDFQDTKDKEYIDAGLVLSQFCDGMTTASCRSLIKLAKNMDSSLFVACLKSDYPYHGNEASLSFMYLNSIPNTVYLSVTRFNIWDCADDMTNAGMKKKFQALKDAAENKPAKERAVLYASIYEDMFDEIIKSGISPAVKIRKGILIPFPTGDGHFGLLKGSSNVPTPCFLAHTLNSKKKVIETHYVDMEFSTKAQSNLKFFDCGNLPRIKALIESFEESVF